MKYAIIFSSLFLLGSSIASAGEKLSETELYYRCHAHLTSKRPLRNSALLKNVKSGKLSAEEACIEVLDQALLGGNGRLVKNTRTSKQVLKTFTDLHMNFFNQGGLRSAAASFTMVTNDIYDEQTPALFYTRALFGQKKIDTIVKGKTAYEGIRSLGAPKTQGHSSGYPASAFTYRDFKVKPNVKRKFTPTYVEVGDLLGVKVSRSLVLPQVVGDQKYKELLASWGGGILGTGSYLLRALPITNAAAADGANKMPRQWSNTVLKDFLCKALPAVRLIDGRVYKRKEATSDFRKADGCIQCHATMDQLAAGGRGMLTANVTLGNGGRTNPMFRYPAHRNINTKAKPVVWPVQAEKGYYSKVPNGVLYFRSYTGDLIKKDFNNLQSLGQAISETEDFYACIAKKYYEHFTGIEVSLADIQDPFSPIELSEADLKHRNKVIDLGRQLKKTGSTYDLVKEILKSDVYRQSDFAVQGGN